MSVVDVRGSQNAAGSLEYGLFSNDPSEKVRHLENGTNRAAALTVTMATGETNPEAFVRRASALAGAHGRKNEAYSYTQNFSPEEFDVNNLEHVQRVHELGVKLVERMHTADYAVVTHTDSAGGHLHNHIYVANHDNLTGKSLQRYTSWKNGLHQLNDELMRDEECWVLPSPEQPKPVWSQRREEFAAQGFEQTLGDKIATALRDPRCVSREAFTHILLEHEVTLAETKRDGWTYKMRRLDNGKLGRRKASSLTDEFTSQGAQPIFAFHENNYQRKKEDEHYGRLESERRINSASARFELAAAAFRHSRTAGSQYANAAVDDRSPQPAATKHSGPVTGKANGGQRGHPRTRYPGTSPREVDQTISRSKRQPGRSL